MLFTQMTQIAFIVRCYKRKVGLFYVRLPEKQGFLIKGAAHRNICRSVVAVNKKYCTQRRSDKKHTFWGVYSNKPSIDKYRSPVS